ncbi:MAG: FG-GAP repeat domain-containing protein, partial [Planctomycetota bacterium]
DHRPDLYLVQGGDPAYTSTDQQPLDRLYQQRPDGRFVDVTEMAHIAEPRYGQGIAVADFNDDGFDDIYVTNVGRNTLYQNQGDGTFVDVTLSAGVGDERWSCSAAWGDLDGDGDLDLYVGNYCDYDPRKPLDCSKDGKVHICHPRDVPPVPDECYINQGDGTFTAEAKQRGLFGEGNRALGIVIADFDRDGDQDIYVANDTTANFLFINQGAGQFVESAITLGCAVDHNGSAQASMGVACGDFDRNGLLDLYCTHFQYESNTLYQNFGTSGFEDVTGKMGLHAPTYAMLGFGTVMVDFDQNGQQELFVANGHIERSKFQNKLVYEMEPQLFSFDGQRFHDRSRQSGDY